MKIAVGLSGGVDSAVSAALLVEQGHEVTGVFLECWPHFAKATRGECRGDKDRQDALGVALKLKIPFKVLDFKKEYKQKVLDIFYREYKAGRTPNPDIWCNREIKFGMFLEWAIGNGPASRRGATASRGGFERVATGHYARVKVSLTQQSEILTCSRVAGRGDMTARAKFAHASVKLYQSGDQKKDQTYFLALLKQKQLEKVMFPIGYLTKKQVRLEAKKRGFKIWDKKDSTGICLIGHDYSFEDFLKRKIKEHRGEVVNKEGKVIGWHKGVEFYTIGQRHNFEITEKSTKRPRYFVVKKDVKNNLLVVGKRQDLAKKEFEVEGWGGIHPLKIKSYSGLRGIHPSGIRMRIRHQGRLIPCRIEEKRVILEKNEYGIASGQVAVIYKTEGSDPSMIECLGGGVII